MPITSSAKKALRTSLKKRVFNLRHKNSIDKEIKQFRKFVSVKDKASAEKMIPTIYKSLDKAVKVDYMKANTASRTKSRIMAALKKIA